MANLRTETKHGRTSYFDEDEDDMLVAVIIEQSKPSKDDRGRVVEGCYQWIVAHNGGRCGFFEDAEDEIMGELER